MSEDDLPDLVVLFCFGFVGEIQSTPTKDARMCITLQPGMAFKAADEPDVVFACVSNLRWAILAWPLQPVQDDGYYILDPAGRLYWKFVTNVEKLEAGILEPSFLPGVGVGILISEWGSALKVLLKQSSEALLFRDLEFLAKNAFGMSRTRSMTRHDLLKALATEVGGREFAEEVLESVCCRKKRKLDQTDFDDLAGIVLEAMDKDEAAEWDDVRVSMKKKEKNAVATKWQEWRKEAGRSI